MSDDAGARVVETHVSLLLLRDDVVYKFKKPVRLPFLDFSTVEARRHACEAEVEANRRLSPDIYLGVASLAIEDSPIDHAVVMRRLPSDRSLGSLVRRAVAGRPGGGQQATVRTELRHLAGHLAAFHARARRSPSVDDAGRPEALASTWRGCLEGLAPFAGRLVPADVVARVDELAFRYLAGRTPLLEHRIAGGRICDGHGDLLADDVFLLSDGPRLLDCIEFDERLRHVDVIADVAFLAMDLEYLGAPELATLFLESYEAAAGDRFPPSLVHHYWAERALVRAAVACVRAEQTGDAPTGRAEATALAELALAHLEEGRVALAVVSGLPGTGKSSLAAALGARLGWPVLSSDAVRREIVAPSWRGPLTETALPGAYSAEITDRTYATVLARARQALGLGQSVILDATFTPARWRSRVEALARDSASDLVVLACEAPPELAAARMRSRLAGGGDVSGADESVAAAMTRSAVPWVGAVPFRAVGSLERLAAQAEDLVAGPRRPGRSRRRRCSTLLGSATSSRSTA